MSDVAKVRHTDYQTSVATALDLIGAAERLPNDRLIILKPNLTMASPPPVTTPVGMVEAVYRYCRAHCGAEIAIGDGCGNGATKDVFAAMGYTDLAQRHDLRLIDFNEEPAVTLRRDDTLQLREFHLPEIAVEAFIVSIPILKDHSFTSTTVAMKNMFGLAPAPYYEGSWNKSKLHTPSTDKSVVDVCLYKAPELCVVDAVIALAGMHLAGTPRKLGRILAGFDPVAVDAVGSEMMGHKPRKLEYLKLANGRLGDMDDIRLLEG